MVTSPKRRLDEMFETVLLTSDALQRHGGADPKFADAHDDAEANYGRALIKGMTGNSGAIENAMQRLDDSNTVARDSLAKSKTAAEVLAEIQKAVDAGVKLLALV